MTKIKLIVEVLIRQKKLKLKTKLFYKKINYFLKRNSEFYKI